MSQHIAERFAQFACKLHEIPEEVLHAADRAIFDTIGVMIAGRVHRTSKILTKTMNFRSGPALLATGGTADSETAAFVNGVAAHVWDFDDTSYTGIMHGSAVVLPAVLAMAQEIGADEESIRRAFVIGSEIAYNLGDICTHEHYFHGWWSTVSLSLVGTAAAVGVLLKLNQTQMTSAIGLAAAASGGAKSVFGTDGKPLLVGDCARRAITFAKWAKCGLTGPERAFEDESGYIRLLNNKVLDIEPLNSLGIKWRLIDPGLLVKSSPVCSAAHSGIEQMTKMMSELEKSIDEIEEVEAEVPDLVYKSLVYDSPKSPQQAQFSLQYSLACSALHGRVRFEDLEEAEIQSEIKKRLMFKIKKIQSKELSSDELRMRYPECTRLTIKFNDGRSSAGFCGIAKGMPENPLSDSELITKFKNSITYAGCDESFEPMLGCNPTETFARLTV